KVARWRLHWQINESKLFIDGDLRPNAGVAGVFRGAFFPGVVAKLALLRNSVKNPEALAGPHVEAARITLIVPHALRSHAFAEGGANDDGVFHNNGRRLNTNFASLEIRKNFLIVVHLQVNYPVFAKRGSTLAGFRVQANQAKAGRHIKNALLFAIGPVREAAS